MSMLSLGVLTRSRHFPWFMLLGMFGLILPGAVALAEQPSTFGATSPAEAEQREAGPLQTPSEDGRWVAPAHQGSLIAGIVLVASRNAAQRSRAVANLPGEPADQAALLGLDTEALSRRSVLERRASEVEAGISTLEQQQTTIRGLQHRLESAEPSELPDTIPPVALALHPTRALLVLDRVLHAEALLRVEAALERNQDTLSVSWRQQALLGQQLDRLETATPAVADSASSAARQRLATESGVIDEVEQQAADARRRAEEARREAMDVERRRLAEALEAAGGRLEALALERREEEQRYEAHAGLEESFRAVATDMERRVASLVASTGSDRTRPERADRIYREALEERRRARAEREELLADLQEVRAALQSARDEEAEARGRLDLLQLGELGAAPELVALRVSAGEATLQAISQLLRLKQLRSDRITAAIELADERVLETARWMDRVTPYLSSAERQERFRLNTENLTEAGRNLQDRTRIWGSFLQNWHVHLSDLMRRVVSVDGVVGAGRLLLVLLLLVIGLRQLRERRHDLIRSALRKLERIEWVGRHYAAILKGAELLRDTTYPLVSWFIVWLIFRQLPDDLALLSLLRVVVLSLLLYIVAITATRTFLLPRKVRERQMFRGENIADFGIDVIDIKPRTARLLVLSVNILLLYLLATTILSHVVATFTGLGLIWHAVQSLIFWGRLALLYALCWYWRDVIVEQFLRMSGKEDTALAERLQRHKDRAYSVLFLLVLAAYVLAIEGWKLTRHHIFEVSLVKRLNNFVFRKRIELAQAAQQTPESERTGNGAETAFVHQAFHEDAFCLPGEELDRETEVERLSKAMQDWLTREDIGGAVAVLGERNMGKTTVILQALRQMMPVMKSRTDEIRLTSISLTERLTQADEAHALLLEIFQLPSATTPNELVQTILAGPRRIVVIDECHNLFLRRIRGFEALDTFLNTVSLTRHRIFWLLGFNLYAWRYFNRVNNRRHFFRETIQVSPLTDAELRTLIDRRCQRAGIVPDFSRLALAGARPGGHGYELVKTSEGYFRLLNEFAGGNPGIAMALWQRSLQVDGDGNAAVSLFRPPGEAELRSLDDEQLFSLTAIAQHENLTASQLAEVVSIPAGQSLLHFNLFREHGFIQVDARGRARLTAVCQRQILNRLRDTNLLYLQR